MNLGIKKSASWLGLLLVIVIILLIFYAAGSRNQFTPKITGYGRVISQCGEYELRSGVLQISRGTGSLIGYRVYDRFGKVLLVNDSAFSDAMRWGFVSDEMGNLWIYSGDVGITAVRNHDGELEEIEFVEWANVY